jgi:G:T-mismatch repair DNA endonuclease (very short patch repair protein)
LKAYLAYDNVVFQDDYMNLAIQIVLHSCIVNIFVLGCFVSNHMVLLFSQFKASRGS